MSPGRDRPKVCILTSAHPVFDARIFHRQAKTLLGAGYDVTLIAPHTKAEVVDGIRIRPVFPFKNRLQRLLVTAPHVLVAAIAERADVYHFHDLELIGAGVILRGLGKAVIYDVHEDYPKEILSRPYLPRWMRRPVAWLLDLAEKAASRLFDAIVVATDDLGKTFRFHRRVVKVRNFPFTSYFVDRENDRNHGGFTCICAGVLGESRGTDKIVEAMEYFDSTDDIKLVLCGPIDPPSYREKVMGLAGFAKAEYIGWVDYRRLPEFLVKADLGIACYLPDPGHLHAMPNKLFLYMAAGIPIISSNFPLWRELVEGNECGLTVDPTSPREIADAIRYLKERPELRKRMGGNGKRAMLEKYSWDKEGQVLLDTYGQVLVKCGNQADKKMS